MFNAFLFWCYRPLVLFFSCLIIFVFPPALFFYSLFLAYEFFISLGGWSGLFVSPYVPFLLLFPWVIVLAVFPLFFLCSQVFFYRRGLFRSLVKRAPFSTSVWESPRFLRTSSFPSRYPAPSAFFFDYLPEYFLRNLEEGDVLGLSSQTPYAVPFDSSAADLNKLFGFSDSSIQPYALDRYVSMVRLHDTSELAHLHRHHMYDKHIFDLFWSQRSSDAAETNSYLLDSYVDDDHLISDESEDVRLGKRRTDLSLYFRWVRRISDYAHFRQSVYPNFFQLSQAKSIREKDLKAEALQLRVSLSDPFSTTAFYVCYDDGEGEAEYLVSEERAPVDRAEDYKVKFPFSYLAEGIPGKFILSSPVSFYTPETFRASISFWDNSSTFRFFNPPRKVSKKKGSKKPRSSVLTSLIPRLLWFYKKRISVLRARRLALLASPFSNLACRPRDFQSYSFHLSRQAPVFSLASSSFSRFSTHGQLYRFYRYLHAIDLLPAFFSSKRFFRFFSRHFAHFSSFLPRTVFDYATFEFLFYQKCYNGGLRRPSLAAVLNFFFAFQRRLTEENCLDAFTALFRGFLRTPFRSVMPYWENSAALSQPVFDFFDFKFDDAGWNALDSQSVVASRAAVGGYSYPSSWELESLDLLYFYFSKETLPTLKLDSEGDAYYYIGHHLISPFLDDNIQTMVEENLANRRFGLPSLYFAGMEVPEFFSDAKKKGWGPFEFFMHEVESHGLKRPEQEDRFEFWPPMDMVRLEDRVWDEIKLVICNRFFRGEEKYTIPDRYYKFSDGNLLHLRFRIFARWLTAFQYEQTKDEYSAALTSERHYSFLPEDYSLVPTKEEFAEIFSAFPVESSSSLMVLPSVVGFSALGNFSFSVRALMALRSLSAFSSSRVTSTLLRFISRRNFSLLSGGFTPDIFFSLRGRRDLLTNFISKSWFPSSTTSPFSLFSFLETFFWNRQIFDFRDPDEVMLDRLLVDSASLPFTDLVLSSLLMFTHEDWCQFFGINPRLEFEFEQSPISFFLNFFGENSVSAELGSGTESVGFEVDEGLSQQQPLQEFYFPLPEPVSEDEFEARVREEAEAEKEEYAALDQPLILEEETEEGEYYGYIDVDVPYEPVWDDGLRKHFLSSFSHFSCTADLSEISNTNFVDFGELEFENLAKVFDIVSSAAVLTPELVSRLYSLPFMKNLSVRFRLFYFLFSTFFASRRFLRKHRYAVQTMRPVFSPLLSSPFENYSQYQHLRVDAPSEEGGEPYFAQFSFVLESQMKHSDWDPHTWEIFFDKFAYYVEDHFPIPSEDPDLFTDEMFEHMWVPDNWYRLDGEDTFDRFEIIFFVEFFDEIDPDY